MAYERPLDSRGVIVADTTSAEAGILSLVEGGVVVQHRVASRHFPCESVVANRVLVLAIEVIALDKPASCLSGVLS